MKPSRRQQLIAAYEVDHVATVLALVDQVLSPNSEDGPVLARVGAVFGALARYEEAQTFLERALALAPPEKRHIVFSHLGDLFKNKGELARAVECYEEASRLLPNEATYHVYRGAALVRLGRLRDGEASYRKATLCSEGIIEEAFHNLGLVLRAQGRFAEARTCFEEALEIDPEYDEAQYALDDVLAALAIQAGRKR